MNILIDTGPIVALLNERHAYHSFADQKMRELKPPFYSCEAVITESFYLLQGVPQGTDKLIALLDAGKIEITFNYAKSSAAVHKIIKKYADLLADFADACLVQMAQITTNARIFTLDAHFSVYRNPAGQPLPLISPQQK